MKIIHFISATFVAIAVLCAPNAKGQSQQSEIGPDLPAFLPIGNEARAFDWVVTNRVCSLVTFQFRYTSSITGTSVGFTKSGTQVHFGSYADFMQSMLTNSLVLKSIVSTQTDIGSPITFNAFISYDYPDGSSRTPWLVSTNIGPISAIGSSTFQNIRPDWIRVMVPISTLEKFELEVDNTSPPYTFTWMPTGTQHTPLSFIPPFPEMTGNGVLVLNQWYSVGSYRARFAVTAAGKKVTYTQAGEAIVPRPMTPPSGGRVTAQIAVGSDAIIESSADFANWQTVASFPWYLGTNSVSTSVDMTRSFLYFRVRSY